MTTLLRFVRPAPLLDFSTQLVALEPLLQKAARKLCGRPEEARDLVQDTIERALKAQASATPNLKAWLLSILHHRFIDLWRKRSLMHEVDELERVPCAQPDEEPRWSGLDGARLRDAVAQLPASHREVFVLHAIEGVAYNEVARKMGIPKATVGTRLFRARARLKVLLEQELRRADLSGDLDLAQRRARRPASSRSATSAA